MAEPAETPQYAKRLLSVASRREGVALCLWGDPGGGKSYQVQQLLAGLTCRSGSIAANAPIDVLAKLFPHPAKLPEWVERGLSQAGEARSRADAFAALLSGLAPVVLHIEDLHAAGEEQLAFWQHLAEGVRRSRGVGLLATSRLEPPPGFEAYRLEALSRAESDALLEQTAGAKLPPEALEWIYQRALGNPLFGLEYFRYLSRQGYLWSDGQRWRWRLPEREQLPTSIEALIAQLVRGAERSPQIEAALAAKAMLQIETTAELWGQSAGLSPEQLIEAKEALEAQGLLIEGEFAHPLFAEVVRQDISPTLRQQIAARAVQALETDHPEEAAAFVEQADIEAPQAIRLLGRATQTAIKLGLQRQAAGFALQAARKAGGSPRIELALQAARLLRDVDALGAVRAAELVLAADPQHQEGIFLTAELLTALGQGDRAETVLRQLPLRAQSGESWLRHMVEARLSREDYQGALRLWKQHPETEGQADAALQQAIGQTLFRLGQFAQAKAFFQGAIKEARHTPLEKAWLQSSLAAIPLDEGDFAGAVQELDAALQEFSSITPDHPEYAQVQSRVALAHRYRSLAHYRWGHFREAVQDLQAYLRLVSEGGNGQRYAEGQANLGLYLLELGQYEQAEEVLLESRAVLERSASYRWLAVVAQGLMRLYLEWAPPHGSALALKHAADGEGFARRSQSPPTLAETLIFVAWAEAVHGTPARASRLLDELLGLAVQLGEPRLQTVAAWVRGLVVERSGEREAALEYISEAVGQMRELGHEPFAHRMALEMDRIKGDAKAASRRIARFEQTGNLNWGNIARRYFPSLGTEALAPAVQGEAAVWIGVLGPMQIEVQGQPIAYSASKGRELLALLLEARIAGRGEVDQLELFDALYPDMDEAKAASALKQLVYRLRTVLGNAAITRTSEGYALGAVASDAEGFLLGGAVGLWRGTYLQGLGTGWDATVSESLYHALHRKADTGLDHNPEETARIGRILLEADPYDRAALALSLRALEKLGRSGVMEPLYRQAVERFEDVGERLPGRWEEFLAVSG